MNDDRPIYRISFRPTYSGADDRVVLRVLRWLLKRALRNHGLQVVKIEVEVCPQKDILRRAD